MFKYDTYIFPNGRIAMIDSTIIFEAIKAKKEVLIVCNAWSGGCAHAVGAENYIYDGEPCYVMYGYDIKDQEFTAEDLSKFYRVIFTPGEMVYMETGDQANCYLGCMKFADWDTKDERINEHCHLYSWRDKLLTGEEIHEKRTTIDEKATVAHIFKDKEEKVKTLIGRGILSKKAIEYVK